MFTMKPVTVKAPAGPARAVAVNAQADRRAVLGGLVAGVASLAAEKAFAAYEGGATPVDLFDDRKAKAKGFDIIYEARDLDLSQAERDGITQFRGDLTATKQRFSESTKRINGPLGEYLDKQYWTAAKEELRNQMGNMRLDMLTLSAQKGTKAERKEAVAKVKDLITACEELDFAIRKKDLGKAQKSYASVKSKVNEVTSFIVQARERRLGFQFDFDNFGIHPHASVSPFSPALLVSVRSTAAYQ
eukprot:TRINITY_DN6845_c0_g1_i2.p1 TRINITY_DN6845_c0_g1~~TRINITY_DN6845_c0_g1_i2.p1  ORF type:complete len:278 (+),score=32.58 TRINITY_DN6845_c0_g1_i2:100-834(+)